MAKPKTDIYAGTWGEKLVDVELTPQEALRLEKFLKFDNPPSKKDKIDVIVVFTTSPDTELQSFEMRCHLTAECAKKYPNIPVIVTGLRPDISKATLAELEKTYDEAKSMISNIVQKGIFLERFIREDTTTNTRDSTHEVFKIIQDNNFKNVLFVCSSYMARRVDLYVKKYLKDHNISDFKYFIIDADVREDLSGKELSSQEKLRKFERFVYEWKRLPIYRRNKDL